MSEPKLGLYANRMKEIVRRTEVIDGFLQRRISGLFLVTTVESIYLQFRNILELIATASLIVNESAKMVLNEAGRRKWHAGDVLDAVEEINPEFFYPKPIRAKEASIPGCSYEHVDFTGDYLTREKFSTLYDVCSKTIHTVNPLDPPRHPRNYLKLLRDAVKWRSRIHALLIHHQFKLVGDDNLYIVQVRDEEHGDPVVWTFERVDKPLVI